MEAGLTDPDKATRAFERLESEEFTHKWGLKLSEYGKPRVMLSVLTYLRIGSILILISLYGCSC